MPTDTRMTHWCSRSSEFPGMVIPMSGCHLSGSRNMTTVRIGKAQILKHYQFSNYSEAVENLHDKKFVKIILTINTGYVKHLDIRNINCCELVFFDFLGPKGLWTLNMVRIPFWSDILRQKCIIGWIMGINAEGGKHNTKYKPDQKWFYQFSFLAQNQAHNSTIPDVQMFRTTCSVGQSIPLNVFLLWEWRTRSYKK